MTPIHETLSGDPKKDLEALAAAVAGPRRSGEDGTPPAEDHAELLGHLSAWLLDGEQRQALSARPWDVFFLCAAALVCRACRNGTPGTEPEACAGDAGAWIRDRPEALGIRSAEQAEMIARICGSVHPPGDGAFEAGHDDPLPEYDGEVVNLPLVSAAAALSAWLDLRSPAALSRIASYVPGGAERSPADLRRAFAVADAGPHPYLPGTIRLRIGCRDPEVHRALKHHENAVQQYLHRVNRRVHPRFLYSDVLFEIEASGYRPVDLRFSVDASAALELLTGNRLYSDNRVFLRELVQNAVDACHLRGIYEPGHRPEIAIAFDEAITTVTVRDNGIGMDRQWIEKYFLKIGISLYRSGEISSAKKGPAVGASFISQFGIGFLSSFLAADTIAVRTRKAGSPGMAINISSLKDYFDVRPLEDDFPVGTEVTLRLKPSRIGYCRSLEFVGYLKTHIRFVRVPVTLVDGTGGATAIGNQPISYEADAGGDGAFVAPIVFGDAEGSLLLRAKRHDRRIFALDTAKGGISVFQDGIFVTQVDALLPEGARGHVIGRINLMGAQKCSLSMDRNRIFWTEAQLQGIKEAVLGSLAVAANRLMDELDRQDPADATRRSLVDHLSTFFDFSQVNDAMHAALCEPIRRKVEKRFRDFVRIHFAHTRRAEGIPEAEGYGEAWQRGIVETFMGK